MGRRLGSCCFFHDDNNGDVKYKTYKNIFFFRSYKHVSLQIANDTALALTMVFVAILVVSDVRGSLKDLEHSQLQHFLQFLSQSSWNLALWHVCPKRLIVDNFFFSRNYQDLSVNSSSTVLRLLLICFHYLFYHGITFFNFKFNFNTACISHFYLPPVFSYKC